MSLSFRLLQGCESVTPRLVRGKRFGVKPVIIYIYIYIFVILHIIQLTPHKLSTELKNVCFFCLRGESVTPRLVRGQRFGSTHFNKLTLTLTLTLTHFNKLSVS